MTDTKTDIGSRTEKHSYSSDCDVYCDLCGVYGGVRGEHLYVVTGVIIDGDTVITEKYCEKCGTTMAEIVTTIVEEELGEGGEILGGN